MKKDIHPKNYRLVVFQDLNNQQTYLTRSTVASAGKGAHYRLQPPVLHR
jgi:ribosomal protein L31